MRRLIGLGLALALFAAAPAMAAPAPPKLVTIEMRVPSATPGLSLYVRNKRPAGVARFPAARTVLFVHGASYPASTAIDLPLGGKSWMDDLAGQGFDVYLVDLIGYGRSDRPASMDQPPEAGAPVETTAEAVADIGKAVDQILAKTGNAKLNLVGWSWGTMVMAGYATTHPDKVERLALYAPLWMSGAAPAAPPADAPKLGAYRTVTRDQARARWVNGVPEAEQAALIPPTDFAQWADATWATDPKAASATPPAIRVPNGPFFDVGRYLAHNQPTWDPAKVTMPILLVVGEWDRDTPPARAQAIFPLLVNAPWKELVIVGEGTHALMLEKNRQQLFDAVSRFLTRAAS